MLNIKHKNPMPAVGVGFLRLVIFLMCFKPFFDVFIFGNPCGTDFEGLELPASGGIEDIPFGDAQFFGYFFEVAISVV
jgi:hypothetical protein